MPSLTPQYRANEATEAAMLDGLLAGGVTLIPSSLAVWAATHNKSFMRSTNYQSRTAMVVMPALFMFAFSSETKLLHKMNEIADESEHSKNMMEWSTTNSKNKDELQNSTKSIGDSLDADKQITALYKKSVEESGIRLVPGDRLGPHHVFANFWQDHPFKLLGLFGGKTTDIYIHKSHQSMHCSKNLFQWFSRIIFFLMVVFCMVFCCVCLFLSLFYLFILVPTVLYIFKGRNDKQHLKMQSKLMQTRVFGQFAVIAMLLTLMGFKEYMDKYGRYITQADADMRVIQMQRMRQDLMDRLEHDKQVKKYRDDMIRNAHKSASNNNDDQKITKKQRKKKRKEVIAIENP